MKKNLLKTICVAMVIAMVGVMCVGCKKKDEYYISVRLTAEASLSAHQNGKIYTATDFPELSLSDIQSAFVSPDYLAVWLALKKPSKKNSLAAAKLLEQRDDVLEVWVEKDGKPHLT